MHLLNEQGHLKELGYSGIKDATQHISVIEEAERMDDEVYVHLIIAGHDVPEAHLNEGSTDNDLNDTVALHDDFDWMAGIHACLYRQNK